MALNTWAAKNLGPDADISRMPGSGGGGGGSPVDLVFPFSANVTFNVSGLGTGQATEFSPYDGINATGFGLAACDEGDEYYSVREDLIFGNQNTDYVMFAVVDDGGYIPYDPTAWSVTVSGSAEILDGGASPNTHVVHITGDCVINAVRTP